MKPIKLRSYRNRYTIPIPDNMKQSMTIPSTVHTYSVGIEYMKNWFLEKFDKNYFGSRYRIDGKHISDEFKNFTSIADKLNIDKPNVIIIPQIEHEFDNDNVLLYEYGIHNYMRRSALENSFFKDKKNNIYITLLPEQLKMPFTIRVRLDTKAEQLDIYKFMQMAFRVGATQGEYKSVDYQIPLSLMLQIAKDAGFEVKNEKVIDAIGFLSYLNRHSGFPFIYKYREIDAKYEYFIRCPGVYMHISNMNQLSADDGERQGHLSTNFVVEMQPILTVPSIKSIVYFSTTKHDVITTTETSKSATIGLHSINMTNIPETNDKGWNTYITTDYQADSISEPLSIELDELFEGSKIEKVINMCHSTYISPAIFMDFKLFCNGSQIEYDMDWENMIIYTKEKVEEPVVNIAIYVDTDYMADQLITLKNLNTNSRINPEEKPE